MKGPPRKRRADASPPATRQSTLQGNRKPTGGRPELQGNRTGRNPSQPAPTWRRPCGSNAADSLERAMRRWGLR
jgi:hypothetical protein